MVRLFEVGSVFRPAGETTRIGWVMTGNRIEHWSGNADNVDVFDAKGIAELLGETLGFRRDQFLAVPDGQLPWFVKGRAARILVDGAPSDRVFGHIGQIRPDIVALRGLDSGVVVGGEIDLDVVSALRSERVESDPRVQAIPRYPSVVRDLSIIVSERLPAGDVRGTIRSNAPATLAAIGEFDRYAGAGVPAGHVSLSIRLTFRAADRTLTDVEVQRSVDAIVAALEQAHGATLRGK